MENTPMTPKARMLAAYRGGKTDRFAVAPEFWFYYPAKLLGIDMIRFFKEVPFHVALKKTFEHFGCEGWGVTFVKVPNANVTSKEVETWPDADTLERTVTLETPHGTLRRRSLQRRDDPGGWQTEGLMKDPVRDAPAWESLAYGGNPEALDATAMNAAWKEVGESYLLEAFLGSTFFDAWSHGRDGEFEQGIYDFMDPELHPMLERLQERHIDYLVRLARAICTKTEFESLFIGCSWSCNSLLGPDLWRRWDKPVLKAVADEIHRHGKLLHVHLHGHCLETVADMAEIGIDCVCPFERPPGGDIIGKEGLAKVERLLRGRTTMNGNVHTVETLIRGTPEAVRREVREIKDVFANNPRVIIGTGDQVGRETPEENLWAMIDEAKKEN